MASSLAELGLLPTYAAQTQEQYVGVAMACLCVWDHIISFDEEVRLVWKSSGWNLVKVLFLVIRYGTTVGYPLGLYNVFERADTPHICQAFRVITALFLTLGHLVQAILSLRVWALYNRHRGVGVLLFANYLAVLSISLALTIKYLSQSPSTPPVVAEGSPQLVGCLLREVPGYFGTLVAALVSETIVVLMTIWKVLRHMRRERRVPIFGHLLSSGVTYYVAMLVVLMLNILTKPFPVLLIPIMSSSSLAVLQSVACCRIVLSLLRQGKKLNKCAPLPAQEESVLIDGFLTIPTGLYTKEMMLDWDYGLPPLEIADSTYEDAFSMLSMTAIETRSVIAQV